MALYSYHIFLFPFQWEKENCKGKPFNERFDLDKIEVKDDSKWENFPVPKSKQSETELFNEKNFFYKFVHNVLYDSGKTDHPIIRHYERKETYDNELVYEIGVKANKEDIYDLKIKSIVIDLFSTGTGILIFYLENDKYHDVIDVKRINQFGRRIFPPYMISGEGVSGTKKGELADFISIKGLNGEQSRYYEDFNNFTSNDCWKPAVFITSLITDLDAYIKPEPVIDDRMFTMCWYLNNDLAGKIKDEQKFNDFIGSSDWHEFLYVDSDRSSCQNLDMQKKLLEKHTYARWQKKGRVYGVTRHSFMVISDESSFTRNILLTYFRTMYARMVELVLVQQSSTLKFSNEVTVLSSLSGKDLQALADNIGKFYQAYIRFVNQVYFREITAQEQGIEFYEMLQRNLHMKNQVKDLDDEIGELHNYAALLDEKKQNQNLSLLTKIGALFIAPSLIASYYGMNNVLQDNVTSNIKFSLAWVFGSFVIISGLILWLTKSPDRSVRVFLYILILIILVADFLLPMFIIG